MSTALGRRTGTALSGLAVAAMVVAVVVVGAPPAGSATHPGNRVPRRDPHRHRHRPLPVVG